MSEREYRTFVKVQRYLEEEDYRKVVELLTPMLEKTKPNTFAITYGAIARAGLGQDKKAYSLWKRGVELYPEDRNLWYNYGNSQMQSERFKGAVTSFNKVIKLDKLNGEKKRDTGAYYQLAFAYYRLKKFSKTEKTIKIICSGPKPKKHWMILLVYSQIAQQRWKSAEASGKRLLAMNPADGYVWQLLGQIAVNRKGYHRAIAYLEVSQAASFNKSNAMVLSQLYRAEQAYVEEVRTEKMYKDADIAQVEHLLGAWELDEALTVLEELDKEYGPNMETSLLRGEILFMQDKNQEALVSLAQISHADYLGLHKSIKKKSAKEKRQAKDLYYGRGLLLMGQIHWLDRRWVKARNIYKQLELIPGYQDIGKSLAGCMQSLLTEKDVEVVMPELLDPPLVVGEES